MEELKGRVCVKIRGKERNMPCVIVDVIDKNFVVIDGLVKKRRCNLKHLKILNKTINEKDKEKIIEKLIKEGIISREKVDKLKKKEEIVRKRMEKKKKI